MLVYENSRLPHQLLLFVQKQLYIAALLSVSLEIGCKPPITKELHLASTMSLEQKGQITLWLDVMPSQKKNNNNKPKKKKPQVKWTQ